MAKTIAFIHPDLGIGGAQQLVVNAAQALQLAGHDVTIFTPHHDPARAFSATTDGSLKIQVRGLFFRSLFGRCIALCSMVRMFLCALYVVLIAGRFDVIIVDQVSGILPLLKLFPYKVVFYCHFPDLLLCTDRKSASKRSYRYFIDRSEEYGLNFADKILVNSEYTKKVVGSTFSKLDMHDIDIMYPCVDLDIDWTEKRPAFLGGAEFVLSLNRYERKKGVETAIQTYAAVGDKDLKLVVAGGFDPRLSENREYLEELKGECRRLGLEWRMVEDWEAPQEADVFFARNLNEAQKEMAIQQSRCLLYTPKHEHFGIVPIEAMSRGVPVLAWRSGGPTETLVHLATGYLAETEDDWVNGLRFLISADRKTMGEKGKLHVMKYFSLSKMKEALNSLVSSF